MNNFIYLGWLLVNLSFSQNITGKVVGIKDGDTFVLLTEQKKEITIRLAEIDCPESGQAFGKNAKHFLSDLIYLKNVSCDITTTDRYGRSIAKVFIGKEYVSEALLKNGLAWHYKKYSTSEKLAALETKARKNKLGLWSVPGAVAPWEWRKN
jgi:micrococcal nuclease